MPACRMIWRCASRVLATAYSNAMSWDRRRWVMLATALGVMLLVSWSAHEQPDREDYVIYLANRKPDALAAEAEQSCGATCTHPIAGLAVSPPQEPFWFEGHDPNSGAGIGGGLTQQLHPARAVLEILNSGEPMSMMAVDIGAAGGNPECAPLFNGTLGHSWGGAQVDPRSITKISEKVRFIQAKAEPPTIAKHLQGACMPTPAHVQSARVGSPRRDCPIEVRRSHAPCAMGAMSPLGGLCFSVCSVGTR